MDYEKYGQVFRSGNITLINCDCMDLLEDAQDDYWHLACVDPPYGIGFDGKTTKDSHGWQTYKKKNWDSTIPNSAYFSELARVSGNQIIWGGNYFTEYLKPSRCWVIWYKVPYDFSLSQAEMAWCSFKSRVRVYERMTNADRGFSGKNIHPTQKPVKLYEWLLTNYAKPGQRILDTHLGSGSSAIAAHYFGVDFVGCEIDKDYFQAAKSRIDAETRQIAMF